MEIYLTYNGFHTIFVLRSNFEYTLYGKASHNPNKKVSGNLNNVEEGLMNKIKLFLFAMAIIVIAAISFKSIVMAAEVTRINKNRGLIVINGSKDDGFVMGATVCFYSTSGEEITCGRVQQTSESYATVKVNNRKAKQIRYGMEAQLEDEQKVIDQKDGKYQ